MQIGNKFKCILSNLREVEFYNKLPKLCAKENPIYYIDLSFSNGLYRSEFSSFSKRYYHTCEKRFSQSEWAYVFVRANSEERQGVCLFVILNLLSLFISLLKFELQVWHCPVLLKDSHKWTRAKDSHKLTRAKIPYVSTSIKKSV
jgi:hypothetical protein